MKGKTKAQEQQERKSILNTKAQTTGGYHFVPWRVGGLSLCGHGEIRRAGTGPQHTQLLQLLWRLLIQNVSGSES